MERDSHISSDWFRVDVDKDRDGVVEEAGRNCDIVSDLNIAEDSFVPHHHLRSNNAVLNDRVMRHSDRLVNDTVEDNTTDIIATITEPAGDNVGEVEFNTELWITGQTLEILLSCSQMIKL